MISSFSSLTYGGSLYLQKKTRMSCDRIVGYLRRISSMLRSATYWTSGSDDSSVTVAAQKRAAAERLAGFSTASHPTHRMTGRARGRGVPSGGAILTSSWPTRSRFSVIDGIILSST